MIRNPKIKDIYEIENSILQIMEFYSIGNIKSIFYHLKTLLNNNYKIIPVIKIKNNIDTETLPIMIIWKFLLDQDKTIYGKLFFYIFTILDQEYYAYILYVYISYLKCKSNLDYKPINIRFREILRQVLQVNYTYQYITVKT